MCGTLDKSRTVINKFLKNSVMYATKKWSRRSLKLTVTSLRNIKKCNCAEEALKISLISISPQEESGKFSINWATFYFDPERRHLLWYKKRKIHQANNGKIDLSPVIHISKFIKESFEHKDITVMECATNSPGYIENLMGCHWRCISDQKRQFEMKHCLISCIKHWWDKILLKPWVILYPQCKTDVYRFCNQRESFVIINYCPFNV